METNDELLPELTEREIAFINEYISCRFNASKAAIAVGYPPTSAGAVGSKILSQKNVRAAIRERLEQNSLSADETLKLISDIAKASLNDYFVIRKKEVTPKLKIPLQQYIDKKQEEYDLEEEYATILQLDGDEREMHEERQKNLNRAIIKLELELKRNPQAYRIINGQAVLEETAELDMAKLVRDKENGVIKSFRVSDSGALQVELYQADNALINLAKIHGLFEKDNKQQANNLNVVVTKEEAKEIWDAINTKI